MPGEPRLAETTSAPARIVFDAQALVAFFFEEDGADAVEARLAEAQAGTGPGFVHDVNLAEVWYQVKRRSGEEKADEVVRWLLEEVGLEQVSSEETWREAARIKADHGVGLADCFALAAAKLRDARILTGGDEDFEVGKELGVEVERVQPLRRHRSGRDPGAAAGPP